MQINTVSLSYPISISSILWYLTHPHSSFHIMCSQKLPYIKLLQLLWNSLFMYH